MTTDRTSFVVAGLVLTGLVTGWTAQPAQAQYYNHSSCYVARPVCVSAPVMVVTAPRVYVARPTRYYCYAPRTCTCRSVYYPSGRYVRYLSRPRRSCYRRPCGHRVRSLQFGFAYCH
jgi:hypothetical protein